MQYRQIVQQEMRDADTPNYERARVLCSKEKSIRGRLVSFTAGFPIYIETGEIYTFVECDDDEILSASQVEKLPGHCTRYWIEGKWLRLGDVLKHPEMKCSKAAFCRKINEGVPPRKAMENKHG